MQYRNDYFTSKEICKQTGKEWRNLTNKEKEKYIQMHQQDYNNYKTKLEEIKKNINELDISSQLKNFYLNNIPKKKNLTGYNIF